MRQNPEYRIEQVVSKWDWIQAVRKHVIKHRTLPSLMLRDWIEYDENVRGWGCGFVLVNCREFKWHRFLFPKFRRKFKKIQERRLRLALDILYKRISEAFDKLRYEKCL